MTNLIPVGSRILVEPFERKIGNLVLVQDGNTHQKSMTLGRVVAIGSGIDPLTVVKEGDVVHFSPSGGIPVMDDKGKLFLVLALHEIFVKESK